MEIDVSALGPLSTAFAALFAKLGVPIKTSVPLPVLEAARSGSFRAEPLPFGAAVAGRVDKHACRFYTARRAAHPAAAACAGFALSRRFGRAVCCLRACCPWLVTRVRHAVKRRGAGSHPELALRDRR
jgi:hypothetical protein